ncbi:hypothetical protein HDE69_004666 [Pedobacter cryoconitis]|uniref:Uncharacterized protein n=1 Tax=Pedobacter cryoconitis TaxID=188932 RepID=A0A7W8YXY2_9SPHI|nr:DUF6624 domain-containing protein [Pedobacter cryoconitis]MBB5623580.1 hypothetical protein [Pedobacter cryoconitis]MBB5645408.1 hypothetical protein [Pedobacter cryoconitis]
MKRLNIYILIITLGTLLTTNSLAQISKDYSLYIDTAKQLFQKKEYIKSAESYTKAFLSNHNLGFVNDRYSAAKSWALGGEIDSAYYQLERSLKGNYCRYTEISTDTAFYSLKMDKRWKKILTNVKINQRKEDKYLSLKFKNLNRSLVAILDTVNQDDQIPRLQLAEIEKKYGWSSTQMRLNLAQMAKNDSMNIKKIKYILDKYGWLSKDVVGERGSDALFLVIQHSDLATQLKYLPLLRTAVKQGKALSSRLALLEDRVSLRQGKKQIYGSQIMRNNKTGKYYIQPLVDPENVDKRRTKVGLSPIKEYVSQWGIKWSIEQYYKDLSEESAVAIQ